MAETEIAEQIESSTTENTAGATTKELMERMGHASPAVALRYQHVMRGRDAAVAAALDRLTEAADDDSGTPVARKDRRRAKGGGG
jgi:hypothetical protein